MRTALRPAGFGPQPDPSLTVHLTLDSDTLVYAIGDVHGSLFELRELEERIIADAAGFSGAKTIVMLGDYVDRGLSSSGVIEHLKRPPPAGFERICLRGNHEQLFVAFLEDPTSHGDWLRIGGRETLESYGLEVPERIRRRSDLKALADLARQAVPADHVAFLKQLPLTVRHGAIVYVHAGLRPGLAPERQSLDDLLFMVDHADGPVGPAGLRVVHGHVASLVPLVRPHRICIDTGAYRTGILTAARVDDGQIRFLKSTDPLRSAAVPSGKPVAGPALPAAAVVGADVPAAEAAATPVAAPSDPAPARPQTAIRFLPEPSADSLPDPTQGEARARPRFGLAAGLGTVAAVFAAFWLTDVDARFLNALKKAEVVEQRPVSPPSPSPAMVAAPEPVRQIEEPTGSIAALRIEPRSATAVRDEAGVGPSWSGLADRVVPPAHEPPAEPVEVAAIAPAEASDLNETTAAVTTALYPPLPPSRPVLPTDSAVQQTMLVQERMDQRDAPAVTKQRAAKVRAKKPRRPRAGTVRTAREVLEERRRPWILFGLLSPRDSEPVDRPYQDRAGGYRERRSPVGGSPSVQSSSGERQAAAGKSGKSGKSAGKSSRSSSGTSSTDRGGLLGGVTGALSGVGDRVSSALGGRSGRSGKNESGGGRSGGRDSGRNSRDD
ncbi:metallophosphoesterase family protein [Chthonobacter albigriseus]|uniref:metallophosphoesterase family protein n=1 Tax=Chthonobacter albigriseus TaxID=1683161 RepID=UPI0015EE5865|nr:metallophosphoesterase family protein [Chthonobacter albigriseus]